MTACPDDDELAAFVSGSLVDAERRRALESHLDTCSLCRATVGHAAAAAPAAEPRVLGRYRLDAELGRGGMGVVWRAWDLVLQRAVAVKLVNASDDDEVWRARALREARALAKLHHPNVIAVYDAGEIGGEMFITTELVDGESLESWHRGRPHDEIVAAYRAAIRGLEAAHAIGLVHRDIKPSNILIARDGRACVGDFGLARSERDPTAPARTGPAAALPNLTADGVVVGTPAYMAPEQARGESVDTRADQYSLCVALAEALLGRLPQRPIRRDQLPAGAWWDAIARGLSESADDRFATIGELGRALDTPRRSRLRRAVAPVAVVCAGAVVLVAVRGGGNDDDAPDFAWTPDRPWSWATYRDEPWRLPARARQIAIRDATTAVALVAERPRRRAIWIDRRTGAATLSNDLVPATAELDALVRAGDDVLALGRDGGRLAAWRFDPGDRHELVGPRGSNLELGEISEAVVAGDRLALCVDRANTSDLVVVDAGTLAPVATRTFEDCQRLAFAVDGTLIVGAEPHVFDLATGEIRAVAAGEVLAIAGPRELVVTGRGSDYVIRRGEHEVDRLPSIDQLQWTPDGTAIARARDGITLRTRGSNGRTRAVARLALSASASIAVDDREALVVDGDAAVRRIDLDRGDVRVVTGASDDVSAIAAIAGALVASSDRLRTWRDGVVQADDPLPSVGAIATGEHGAAALLEGDELAWWDPARRSRTPITDDALEPIAFDRAELYYARRAGGVMRVRVGSPPEPWLALGAKLAVLAILVDDRTELVAAADTRRVYLVDRVTHRAWTWTRDGSCGRLHPRTTAVTAERRVVLAGVTVLEPDRPVRHFALPGSALATLRATGEVALVDGRELSLWVPGATTRATWTLPVGAGAHARSLAIDARGMQLGVGFDTGAAAWAWLPEVRSHAESRPVAVAPRAGCVFGDSRELSIDDLR